MGKGDKKSKRGKIFMGSYGVRRRRKKNKTGFAATAGKPKAKETKKVVTAEETAVAAEAAKPKKEAVKKPAAKKTADKPAAKKPAAKKTK